MRPEYDERDKSIQEERETMWNKRRGPRVGDFVKMADGTLKRFTYNWGDGIQTTANGYGGSFHLGKGYVSYSGGLDPAIPRETIRYAGKKRAGSFWFFHHGHMTAHNGVETTAMCRVYEVAA